MVGLEEFRNKAKCVEELQAQAQAQRGLESSDGEMMLLGGRSQDQLVTRCLLPPYFPCKTSFGLQAAFHTGLFCSAPEE